MPTEIRFEVTDDDKVWRRILASMGGASDLAVAWGIFRGAIAQYAAIQEFGAPRANIPSRPFLRSAVDKATDVYFGMMRAAFVMALDGSPVNWKNTLNQIGVRGRNDVDASIMNGNWAPNAQSTVKSKKSSRPLIDTGVMRNAVTWAVGRFGRFS